MENKDILDQVLDIPVLAEFIAEPVPTLDIEQRVLTFLAERFGAIWQSADVAASVLPSGVPVYVVFGRNSASGETGMLVVGENADGSLAIAAPVPLSNDDEDSVALPHPASTTEQDYLDERQCLERIIPALIEARDIVAASGRVKPKRKKRIRREIAHACEHLQMHLESLRRSA